MLTKEKKEKIISALVADIQNVLKTLFMGAGRFNGKRFEIGDISGSPGDSLLVTLSNGVWMDHQSGEKGDIIELWVKKYGSFKTAIREIHSYLNIPMFKDTIEQKTKSFKKPVVNWKGLREGSDVYNYLTIERKLSKETLEAYNVKEKNDEKGSWYAFVSKTIDGQLCGVKYTNLVRKKNPSGKMKKVEYQSENPLSVLFGMDVVSPDTHKYIIITEGQIDAMSFYEQGVKNAVSMPMGANETNWVAHCWDYIIKFEYVVLCFDDDAAGKGAVEKIAKMIGIERCRHLSIPKYKDANEAHVSGFHLNEILNTAKEFKPSKIVSAGELVDESWKRVIGGRRELKGIPFCGWESECDTINFRQRPQEMTLYTGYPGSGKSTLLYQNVAALIFKYNQKVVIASLEEDAEDIAALIAIAAAGFQFGSNQKDLFYKIYKEMTSKLFFYHHRNRADHEDVLRSAEFCIRRYGAQHFILDSVAKTDLDIEDKQKANDFVGKICSSMNETGAHYHIVAHARKGNERDYADIPTMNHIKGVAAFAIETFNVVSMWRNAPKEALIAKGLKDADAAGDFHTGGFSNREKKAFNLNDINKRMADSLLIISKQKVGGVLGQYDLWFDKETYRLKRSYHEQITTYIPWLVDEDMDNLDDDEV